MGPIYELTGDALESFLASLGISKDSEAARRIYGVRVAIDGGFKISVNHGTWTPPLGEEYK